MIPVLCSDNSPLQNSLARPSQPFHILPKALSNATTKEQKSMLGEALYPLVEELEPWFAEKITGMLLELGQNEILNLLDSPSTLKEKVKEVISNLGSESELLRERASKNLIMLAKGKVHSSSTARATLKETIKMLCNQRNLLEEKASEPLVELMEKEAFDPSSTVRATLKEAIKMLRNQRNLLEEKASEPLMELVEKEASKALFPLAKM